jgi:hypothetical protein
MGARQLVERDLVPARSPTLRQGQLFRALEERGTPPTGEPSGQSGTRAQRRPTENDLATDFTIS